MGERVVIDLSADEAIVLLSWVMRRDENAFSFVDEGEEMAFQRLVEKLAREVPRMDERRLQAARDRVRLRWREAE